MNTCRSCGSEVAASDERCANCGTQLKERASKLIGKKLGDKYEILDLLGSGGMCDVFRARHTTMDKEVAVKVLKPELALDSKITQRFEQEARAASRIHHPHAINVTDSGTMEDGLPFIVMELVKGSTLGELLRVEGAFAVERAANILRQVCGALDAAHAVGVIHRDIKPDNIIIAEYDKSDWVEVLDFGVAKIQEDVNRRSALTGANIIVGTPRYMSPEQCDEKPVDARSDVYSLGVVLYEMLSGEAPFAGDSSTRLLMAHASEPPAPLGEKRPDISPEIEAVVMRSLEKDPARRPQTASEFAQAFEEAAGLGQQARAGANRAGAFSRISVPLGEEVVTPPPALDDDSTLVRPRPAQAQIPPADTPAHQRVDTPYNQAVQAGYPTPPAGVTYVAASRDYRGSNSNAWVIGLVALLIIVAGVAGYLAFGNKLFGPGSTDDAVNDAQQAITDATARVDMLPPDHALRSYLRDLAQWQGELRAYQQVKEYNQQVIDKAQSYKHRAEDITNQARAALATLPTNRAITPTAPAQAAPPKNEAAAIEEIAGKDTTKANENAGTAKEGEEEEKGEEKGKSEDSKNANRPRRADPPVLDPVKPAPGESKPANSNRPRNDKPPSLDKVNPPEKDGSNQNLFL